jgi:DNA-binding PadR family transcriptional regulator
MGEQNQQTALTEAVYYILLSLHNPMHGYGIMQQVREMSGERVGLFHWQDLWMPEKRNIK